MKICTFYKKREKRVFLSQYSELLSWYGRMTGQN